MKFLIIALIQVMESPNSKALSRWLSFSRLPCILFLRKFLPRGASTLFRHVNRAVQNNYLTQQLDLYHRGRPIRYANQACRCHVDSTGRTISALWNFVHNFSEWPWAAIILHFHYFRGGGSSDSDRSVTSVRPFWKFSR